MAKKKSYVITDKQTQIKNYVKNLLALKNIIDDQGNILDLVRYRSEIEQVKKSREAEFQKNATVDGVVIDRELGSVLVGEIEYLDEISKYTKNINSLSENPITSYEDLQKTVQPIRTKICTFFMRRHHK